MQDLENKGSQHPCKLQALIHRVGDCVWYLDQSGSPRKVCNFLPALLLKALSCWLFSTLTDAFCFEWLSGTPWLFGSTCALLSPQYSHQSACHSVSHFLMFRPGARRALYIPMSFCSIIFICGQKACCSFKGYGFHLNLYEYNCTLIYSCKK